MPDQLGQFLQNAQELTASAPEPDPNEPLVPFQSALKLTRDQEKKLIDYAFKRLTEIDNESGRQSTLNPTWWSQNGARMGVQALASQGLLPIGDTFMGKRSRYDATFLNDVSWRPFTLGPDTIFNSSNIAVPVVRRVCRQMIARAKNSFFGSDPWFSVQPAPVPEQNGTPNADLAERIERFCQFKLHESASRDDKERAIERALILGECVVKTSYVVRDQIFDTEARVLVDVQGEPVRAADGNHITEDDEWEDKPTYSESDAQPTLFQRAKNAVGKMTGAAPTVRVLKRDGVTQEPPAPLYQTMPMNRRMVLFEGARSEPCYFKDILIPTTASDIQTADCVVHLYDKAVAEFVDLVVKRGMVGDETDERLGAAKKMTALIQKLANNSTAPKSAEKQDVRPGENWQNGSTMVETGGPVAEFAEFYLWYDVYGDGTQRNIMMIADRNSRAPVFYDFVPNVTTDGLRPLEVVRINPVEGRWYGMGIFELFESYQTIIDLLVNRWNFSQSRSGRIDLFRATDTLEGDRDPNLKINWGGIYTPKPGVDIEGIVKSIYLTDIKFEQVHEMIEFFLQLLMNESGVSNANDDQAAGMQSAKLATGIIETQKSGDELFQPIIEFLKGPLARLLNREISVTLANMNPEEWFTYLEGDTLGIAKLTPDDVRGLKFKTVIELTTMKNNAQLQMSAQAAALVEKFYMLSPEVQQRVAGFYRDQLRILDPKTDANAAIQPIQPQPPAPQPIKPSLTVAVKWEQLSPSEKLQFAEKIGIDENGTAGAAEEDDANGSTAKLGDPGAGGATPFPAQLSQAANKKAG